MDIQRGPLLNWSFFHQAKGMEELRQSLLVTTVELENTKLRAEEELKMKNEHIIQLKYMLDKAIKDRDDAQDKCQRLILDKQMFLQNQQIQQSCAPLSGISSIEDEPRKGMDYNGFSSSDCEESIVSSPNISSIPPPQPPPPPPPPPATQPSAEEEFPFLRNRALPERGRLLQAVIKAGPLLQTLLVAGPLPQWRHPPPPLDTCQIPPPPLIIPSSPPTNFLLQDSFIHPTDAYNLNTNNCGRISRKRGPCEGSDTSSESKYQRLLLP